MCAKSQLQIFALCLIIGTFATRGQEGSRTPLKTLKRKSRHIIGLYAPIFEERPYTFCEIADRTAACLDQVLCLRERGRFLGYCGYADGVCCDVVKTCGDESSAHSVRIQNPRFPRNESTSRLCAFTLHIARGICAVRLTHELLEFSKYSKDYCPVDSLTILGTKNVTAPLCGNMTGWQASFEVNELSSITLSYTLQGNPKYRFSSLLTQLPCNDIVSLRSSINAGIKNMNADKYVPDPSLEESTTTEAPEKETTTTEAQTTDETVIEITTAPPESDPDDFIPSKRVDDKTTTTSTTSRPTPLPTGTFRTTTVNAKEVFRLPTNDGRERILLESYYDPYETSTIFRKIFESRVNDQCYVYEDPEFNEFLIQENKKKTVKMRNFQIFPEQEIQDKCWIYDSETQSYKVNEKCGELPHSELAEQSFRVIGGYYANLNEYPWQAALTYKKRFFCGGALISDRHVLTASHCVFGSFYEGIHNLKVSLGDHDLRTKNDTDNRSYGVKRVIWNLHYVSDTTRNDIAILELEESVEFSYSVSPVSLPTDLKPTYEGQNATVTGWGRENLQSKQTSPILREYTGPIDNIHTCVQRWMAYPGVSAIQDMHICLNVTYGTPCHGDSGGPLVACSEAKCTLIGVVSFGYPLCKNVGLPAVFTRVTTYKRWIDINTTPLYYHRL